MDQDGVWKKYAGRCKADLVSNRSSWINRNPDTGYSGGSSGELLLRSGKRSERIYKPLCYLPECETAQETIKEKYHEIQN